MLDEYYLILNDPRIKYPSDWKGFFLEKFWSGKYRGIYYRPLITLSYAFCWMISKDNPLSYHIFNLLFHLGVVVVLFFLSQRFLDRAGILATFIFAILPSHTEAVCWIPARTDLMAGFFLISAWSLWLKKEAKDFKTRLWFYLACSFLWLLALFSKEMAITMPALIFLYDWWRGERGAKGIKEIFKKDWLGYLLMAGVLAFYLILRHKALSAPGPAPAPNFMERFNWWEKPLVVFRLLSAYLMLGFFPNLFYFDWAYKNQPLSGSLIALLLVSALLWIMAVACLVWAWRKRVIIGLLGWLWLISLFPVLHIFSFPTPMAERFYYLPSMFFCLGFVWLIERYLEGKLAKGAVFLLLVFYFLFSFSSAQNYQTRIRYLRRFIKIFPQDVGIRNALGQAYMEKGWLKRAEQEFNRSISLFPECVEAYTNLSLVKLKQGEYKTAINLLQKAIKINPSYDWAHYVLGMIYKRLSQTEQAEKEFLYAYKAGHLDAGYQLALLYFEQKNTSKAKSLLDQMLSKAGWHLASIKLRLRIALWENDREKISQLLKLAEKYRLKDPFVDELKKGF